MTTVKTSARKNAVRKFESKMGLHEARASLLAAVRGVKSEGFTERAGKVLRDTLSVKFGTYVPSDIMDALRKPDFAANFQKTVDAWVKGWDNEGVSVNTQDSRAKQLKAVEAFAKGEVWSQVADAIESMLAARAQQVTVEDNAGNKRVHALVDVLDLMFGIRMTPARAASLKLIA